MILFKTNKISFDSETIAEQLRSTRQKKKIKLKEVAKKININYKYLRALEKSDYKKLPAGIYGKNYLREYALFLGLDYNQLVKLFKSEQRLENLPEKRLFSKQRVKGYNFLALPKIIKAVIIVVVTLVCLTYLGFKIENIIAPPDLIIESPKENVITKNHIINVIGRTEAEAQVIINNEPVLSNTTGEFSKIINLKNGVNIITITASKKFGRDNTIIRQVLVVEE